MFNYILNIYFYKNIFLFIIMNSRIKSTTCTFCEDQCAIEFQKYQELLQYEKTISGCEQKPKYQSRDAVKSAYCRGKISHRDASMMLRNIFYY